MEKDAKEIAEKKYKTRRDRQKEALKSYNIYHIALNSNDLGVHFKCITALENIVCSEIEKAYKTSGREGEYNISTDGVAYISNILPLLIDIGKCFAKGPLGQVISLSVITSLFNIENKILEEDELKERDDLKNLRKTAIVDNVKSIFDEIISNGQLSVGVTGTIDEICNFILLKISNKSLQDYFIEILDLMEDIFTGSGKILPYQNKEEYYTVLRTQYEVCLGKIMQESNKYYLPDSPIIEKIKKMQEDLKK